MIVLIDDNDFVYARGIKNVLDAEGNVLKWGKGLNLRREYLPDNTNFDRIDGGFVISEDQPAGWDANKEQGAILMTNITNSLNAGTVRDLKTDSLAGLIERMARVELLLDIIAKDVTSGNR